MDEISIKDVLGSVGENINPARDILGIPSSGVDAKTADGSDIIVDTSEFNLTKSYFENLGVIMVEYLATTTLGDLARKAPANAQANANQANTQANNTNNASNNGFNANNNRTNYGALE
jgi:Rrf2 family iron-sulfur cluster assembly transcriptional regulator